MTASSAQGVLGAAQAEVRCAVAAFGGVAFQVQGTFTGTITFEASIQGADFTAFRVVPANSSTPTSTTTSTGLWAGSAVGYTVVRARMSAYTNGKAVVFIQADLASPGGGGGGGGVGSDVNLIEVGGSSIALGQAAMAASLPVVVASNQTAIPVTGSISATNPSVGPTGDPVPAEATNVGVEGPTGELETIAAEKFDYDSDGGGAVQLQSAFGIAIPASGGPVPVGAANPLPMSAASLPLPSGAATEATLSTLNGKVTAVNTNAVTISAALPAGNNNIGDVDVASLPALPAGNNNIGDVDVASLPTTPAGTNLIGRVSASAETSTIYNATTALTPKFAIIAEASSGANEVVAAVALKKIRVLNYTLLSNGTVNAKWQSASTDISGLLYMVANVGASPAYAPTGHFETVAGEALNLNLSGNVAVGGHLSYVEV